jgi:hypothetical protein
MEAEAAAPNPPEPTLRDDARAVVWSVLLGAGAGAIAGFVVGGIGGRLAMLLLRLTSSESVVGVISDDGFEIGRFSGQTLNLVGGMTMLGALNGVLYSVLRDAIPVRLRLPLWTGLAALVGGSSFVHDDGVDFTLLDPKILAIALFVALPGIAAALVVLLVERWSDATPWGSRRLTAVLIVASLASTLALVFAAVVSAIWLAVRHSLNIPRKVHTAGRMLVPAVLTAIALFAGVDLVDESSRILD